MIDAEHSYFQPAIDHATLELQRVFNVHKPTVFNTIQCYTTVCTYRSFRSSSPIMEGECTTGPNSNWLFVHHSMSMAVSRSSTLCSSKACTYCWASPRHHGAGTLSEFISLHLQDSWDRLCLNTERARREGWLYGAKLVRGAYMQLERERARQKGYPSPIWDTIQQTHDNYNRWELLAMLL